MIAQSPKRREATPDLTISVSSSSTKLPVWQTCLTKKLYL